jgi:threonine synthase
MSPTRASGPARWQQCASCGERLDELDPRTQCPSCDGLLDVRFHLLPGRATELRRAFADRLRDPEHSSGVWRYAEFVMDAAEDQVVTFPEGNTPLVRNTGLAEWTGVESLRIKHEGLNPTGSFKDRGMTVGVTQARRIGARAVACASTGNTSASLAAYAALAGLPAIVLVPAGRIASGKLAQTLAYGARTLAVRGDFDTCLSLVRQAARQLGVYLLNSVNPWRIEGQKTIVLELLQQLGWRAPDWIALPAGNLGNTAAFGKALEEASAAGLIDRIPRLLAVQAAGAAPFHASYSSGFHERVTVKAETVASAIRIGDPASYDRGVRAITWTGGAVIAVDDGEILDAQEQVGQRGIGCEPASAASIAGVRAAARSRLIGRDASVVAVLTGHVLKDPQPEPVPGQERRAERNRPVEIDPTIEAIARELRLAGSRRS